MNNQRHYGLIDSLVITRNGNQLKAIEDYAQKHLTYTGASDFYDGYSYNTEYYYNANGALESDINRDIDLIQYDDLGNTRCIYYFGQNQIEYVYAADGTKLRTIHRPASSSALTDSIDYIGNLIIKNGQPSMYLFDGGYASFDANGAVDGWHYYIQDYMGNNRMVVNKNGTVEQVTHYYPYGGVIGDISTNESLQAYKFEGKELDRTFGLDNYDILARQYFAMMPSWDRIDSKAEDYYHISPYAYCGGDPVNLGDYNGMDLYHYDDYGNLTSIEKLKDFDQIIVTAKDGNTVNFGKQYEYGTISNVSVDGVSVLSVKGDAIGTEIFEFLSDNTVVEFGQIKTGEESTGMNYVSSLGEKSLDTPDGHKIGPNRSVIESGIIDPPNVREVNHSHPSGSNPSKADIKFASWCDAIVGKELVYNIYIPNRVQPVSKLTGNKIPYLPYSVKDPNMFMSLFYNY